MTDYDTLELNRLAAWLRAQFPDADHDRPVIDVTIDLLTLYRAWMDQPGKAYSIRTRTRPELLWIWDDGITELCVLEELGTLGSIPALERTVLKAYMRHILDVLGEL